MTPMQRIKPVLDLIEDSIHQTHPTFKRIELVKKKERYWRWTSLPVKQDYIRIYYDERKQFSIGLEISYEGKDIEQWTAKYTLAKKTHNDDEGHCRFKVLCDFGEMSFSDLKKLLKSIDISKIHSVDDYCLAVTGKTIKQHVGA